MSALLELKWQSHTALFKLFHLVGDDAAMHWWPSNQEAGEDMVQSYCVRTVTMGLMGWSMTMRLVTWELQCNSCGCAHSCWDLWSSWRWHRLAAGLGHHYITIMWLLGLATLIPMVRVNCMQPQKVRTLASKEWTTGEWSLIRVEALATRHS